MGLVARAERQSSGGTSCKLVFLALLEEQYVIQSTSLQPS